MEISKISTYSQQVKRFSTIMSINKPYKIKKFEFDN